MDSYWECGICTLLNDYINKTCDACGNTRPAHVDETRVDHCSVSDNWSCPQCTYMNNGKNDICAICNTPQSAGAQGFVNVPTYSNNGVRQRQEFTGSISTDELRIVIIGKTGTGKSSTGNTILGKKEFESKVWAASVTSKCSLGMNERFGRKFVVVDTPGLYDTGMTNEQVTKEIVKCIGMTAPGPHAILLTVHIGRFTREEQDTVKHFVDHFGVGMYKYLMVVFTRADDLEHENVDINDYIRNAPPELKAILHLCDNRFIPFNNKLTGHRQEQQVKHLISRVDGVVNKNGGCCYTNEMYEEAEKTLQRREAEVKRKLQEEKQRQVDQIRNHLRAEFDEKFSAEQQEKERLQDEIEAIEKEKRRADERENEMRDQISSLQDDLKDCKREEENRNRERERMLEINIQEMQRQHAEQLQEQKDKANEDRIARLQKQMEDAENRRQREMEEMKRESDRRVREIEERYKRDTETTTLRDKSRRECEKEEGVLSQLWGGLKSMASGVVKGVTSAVKTVKKACVIS